MTLKMTNDCFSTQLFFASATSFKEIAAEMKSYVSEKINDTMTLKKR
jgi:hypothetical protein